MNTARTAKLNEHVVQELAGLAESFSFSRPFKHVCIDNFFDIETAEGLRDSFPAFDVKLATNEDGLVGAKAVNEKVTSLGPPWIALDQLVQSRQFREVISAITNIPDLQYDPHYFGGGTHENLHGQGLQPHIDFNFHPITRQHRRLNLIVYLNEEWLDEWGGSIQLHRDPYLEAPQNVKS